jgi:hypothetical protein
MISDEGKGGWSGWASSVGTVNADGQPGKIRFDFHEIPKPDSATLTGSSSDKDLINYCFDSNKQMSPSVNQPPSPATDCQ